MCEFCRVDEAGDGISDPLISNADSLFESQFEVQQRIYSDCTELYIGIGSTEILCHRQKWIYCPMCGRKLTESEGERQCLKNDL